MARRFSKRDHFCVGRGIAVPLAAILASGDHASIADDDGADRHLAEARRRGRRGKRFPHESRVGLQACGRSHPAGAHRR